MSRPKVTIRNLLETNIKEPRVEEIVLIGKALIERAASADIPPVGGTFVRSDVCPARKQPETALQPA
jgi:hypothetical protein